MTTIKRLVNKYLAVFGYTIKRTSKCSIDVRKQSNDPRLFFYHKQPILINAPTKYGRIRFFPLTINNNPFVCAAFNAIKQKDKHNEIKKTLNEYYNKVQPKSPYEWFSINKEDAPRLNHTPIWAVPDPWRPASIEQKTLSMQKVANNESKKHGKLLSIYDGDKCYGPVTEDKLNIEAVRLRNTLNSIIEKGYKRHSGNDGDIQADVLMNENGLWTWQVTRGLHRAAVLSALNWEHIPVRVVSVVFRGDVDIWPNVATGLFSKKAALKYFDNIFDGIDPYKLF